MKFRKYILILLVLTLQACAADMEAKLLKGIVDEVKIVQETDSFNNSITLHQSKHAYIYASDGRVNSQFEVSLEWSSELPNNSLVLNVYTTGIRNIKSIQFNVDGKTRTFNKSIDVTTDYAHDPYGLSRRSFLFSQTFLKSLYTANSVNVRVIHLDRTHEVGDFKRKWIDVDAYTVFKNFLLKLESIKEVK